MGAGWAIYNVVVKAFVGALQETAQLLSAIISLYRGKKEKQEVKV